MHRIKPLLQFSIRDYVNKNVRIPLKRILPYVLPYWKVYAILFLFLFINLFTTFLMAWFLQHITDAAINKDFLLLKKLFILGFFILIFVSVMSFLNSYVESAAIHKVRRDLKIALFDKMLRMRPGQFMAYHSGELLSRMTNDINGAAGLIGSNLLHLIRLPLSFIAVFFYLASMNWKLSMITLAVAPLVLASGLCFGVLTRNNSRLYQENLSKINSFLNDVSAGYSVIRTFSLERIMFKKYKEYNEEQLALELKEAKLSGGMGAGSSTAGLIAYFLNLGIGTYLVASGSLSIGSLLAFVSLIGYLVYPFTGLASSWISFQRSVAAFERAWEILGSSSEYKNMPESIRSPLSSLSVELRNVSFSYDGQTDVIQNLSLTIPAGKVIAIVGPSGAGKSTLLKLLLGFYKPAKGEILFNHQPMQQYSPSILRSFMAYVPQESYLFDGTIRQNLQHGYPDSSEMEWMKASKEANIHDFIQSLPEKYESPIGERGVRLSGGQKQRISIARAILKNAPLLLLDEATSSLDNENEFAVQESLDRLMKNRTTVVIAHRLSTIQNADWIVVMDKGKVVAQGKHPMLLQQDNPYSRMYRLQFRYRCKKEKPC